MDGFVHLHVHSHYSLLDGAGSTAGLARAAKAAGMDALALTDHGNLFGAVDFYDAAKREGIKPILGLEAYISPTTRQDKSMGNQTTACYHMVLLAMNDAGWLNLKRLSSRSYIEGFYYKPRIDRELLREFNEGLICTTACLGGEVPSALLGGDYEKAKKIAAEYLEIFGPERFYIEVQNAGLDEQTRTNPDLVKIAGELGVGIVGTNDVHFVQAEDKPSHEVLTCVSTGKTLADTQEAIRTGQKKMVYSPELYLRSPEEMRHALREFPQACDNTLKIAEMCNLDLKFDKTFLPVFPVPEGLTDDEHLAKLAWAGLGERFAGREIPQEYKDRLTWELKVLKDKGYSSYFLIVNDLVEYARQHSIPSAPRGSGVATLLGYALKIAEVDPLEYGLLFERFTDPQREEAPDIDIDICQEGRAKIIQYVRDKYGHVAQIITYGTLKAKAVLKDVGRVLDVPLSEVDSITKLIPDGPGVTLAKALKADPDLQKLCESDARFGQMLEHGRKLEGLCRHTGIHAAGVIVADVPLEDVVPLYRQANSDDVITQWDGPTSERAGLMKMDFLGLRTLTIIQHTREMVAQRIGKDIDPEKIPLDDDSVYELFRRGHTAGVFQFESEGMRGVLKQMKPGKITDLIAANAMYRPGPMELIPTYCHRKNGTEEVPSLHELVDDILAETYGIMAYQEQVMQVLNRLGKLPLNRALTLIKAISKKKLKVIAAEKSNFIEGAEENGISQAEAQRLFSLIEKFAGYGFNKAHSTRYAIVAYQTAYFKKHYPREFLASVLTYECGDTDKVVQYMGEAKRMGIKVLPPDVNTCGSSFAVDGEAVRFGLAAVKGVGGSAVDAIVAARQEVGQFTDLYHFCEFVDSRAVNKGAIEALIKCGAFDSLGAHRAAMIAALDGAVTLGQAAAVNRKSGQLSFFGPGGALGSEESAAKAAPRFPDVAPWSETQLLAAEKDTLGFYVSSHPLVKYGRELTSLSYPPGVSLARLDREPGTYPHDSRIRIGCMIRSVRKTVTKAKGEKMAMVVFEDLTGKYEAVVFPRAYQKVGHLLSPEALVFVTGSVGRDRDRPNIIVDEITPIDQALESFIGGLELRLPESDQAGLSAKIAAALRASAGQCPVHVLVRPDHRPDVLAEVRVGRELYVQPTRPLVTELEDLLGDQALLKLQPRPVAAGERKGARRWNNNNNKNNKNNKTPANQNAPASAAVTRFN